MRGGSASRLVLHGLLGVAALFQIARIVAAEPVLLDTAQAEVAHDQRSGEPLVSFRFTEASAREITAFTRQNIGRTTEIRVAGKVLSRPVIREPILGGAGQISGHFSVQEARDLAAHLTAGTKLEIEAVAN